MKNKANIFRDPKRVQLAITALLATPFLLLLLNSRGKLLLPESALLTIVFCTTFTIIAIVSYYKNKIKFLENRSKEVESALYSQIQFLENSRIDAEKTNQLKSQFLANMSHELRTPMHAILSFAKISLKKMGVVDNMQLIRYIETIHHSGSRLLNIINEILDISRLESGVSRFEFEDHDIAKMTKETVRVCQSFILDKSISFEFTNQASTDKACIDEMRISQVIQNLVANAIKFVPDHGKIEITLRDDSINGEPAICFKIDDNGIGIPEDELDAVFDKFIQSSKTASGAGGSGLGLCICKELIEAHSGTISASNNSYGGASLRFSIPIHQEHKELEIITNT